MRNETSSADQTSRRTRSRMYQGAMDGAPCRFAAGPASPARSGQCSLEGKQENVPDAYTLAPVFARLNALLSGGNRPPIMAGVIAAVALVAACTGIVYPLKQVTTVSSLGVVYLLGVVVVSAFWGVWLGVATSLLSAAAFNFFHLPPVGRFTIADSRNWVALGAFFVAALATSWVSELARHRAGEAERRRAEADLTAEMARLVLPRAAVADALALIGRRLAAVFELPWATITLEEVSGNGRRLAIPLGGGRAAVGHARDSGRHAGRASSTRLSERAVPPLSAVLELALEREALMAEAVQTEGLRRSEAVKTAVLRAVSHDLRSPVTAMVAAGAAVRAPELSEAERDELGRLVVAGRNPAGEADRRPARSVEARGACRRPAAGGVFGRGGDRRGARGATARCGVPGADRSQAFAGPSRFRADRTRAGQPVGERDALFEW